MNRIKDWTRPHLLTLKPYSSARDEYTGSEGVFLDANENSMGSAGGNGWNRYPDPYQSALKKKVAEIKGVSSKQIFLGNGSDEPIDLLIRAFCEPGQDKIACFSPTYGMYKVSAGIHNVELVAFEFNEEFSFRASDILASEVNKVKIFFVCSPNNPSGNLLPRSEIQKLLGSLDCLVVIDEAYIDFCEDHTWIQEIEKYDNLVVLQTFSKAWGMAAYRLGAAYANDELIKLLNSIKAPYNINGPIQQASLEALSNASLVRNWVGEIIEQRELLIHRLKEFSMVRKVYPSDANFLLVKFEDSAAVFQYMLSKKIILRDRSAVPGCEGCLRITVGTQQENDTLIENLKEYDKKNK